MVSTALMSIISPSYRSVVKRQCLKSTLIQHRFCRVLPVICGLICAHMNAWGEDLCHFIISIALRNYCQKQDLQNQNCSTATFHLSREASSHTLVLAARSQGVLPLSHHLEMLDKNSMVPGVLSKMGCISTPCSFLLPSLIPCRSLLADCNITRMWVRQAQQRHQYCVKVSLLSHKSKPDLAEKKSRQKLGTKIHIDILLNMDLAIEKIIYYYLVNLIIINILLIFIMISLFQD